MRGFIVMAMFAVSLSHAGSHKYSEVRNLELDASGLSDMFIDAGAGALIVNGVEGSGEIVVVATIVVEGEEEEARKLIEKRLRLDLERVDYWQGVGAQISDRVKTLVSEARAAAS